MNQPGRFPAPLLEIAIVIGEGSSSSALAMATRLHYRLGASAWQEPDEARRLHAYTVSLRNAAVVR